MLGASITVASYAIGAVLMTAALRRFLLTWSAVFAYRPALATTARPMVWIACACRNEAERLPRLLASVAALRYPEDRLRILLVDDSSDDATPELMRSAAACEPEKISTLLLTGRQHGKADCIWAAVAGAGVGPDDLLFVIDVDHTPAPDAIENVVAYFVTPDVAAVAIRHPVRTAATLVSAYCFLEAIVTEDVTSRGQCGLGLPTKLAGSWACRADVFQCLYPGGWQLVDDTVFTARIIAAGGHIPYAADVVVVQDVPDTVRGYVSQHLRWSAGYSGGAGEAIRADAERRTALQNLDGVATYAGYFERPLLIVLALLALFHWFAGGDVATALALASIVLVYAVVLTMQIAVALHLSRADARLWLLSIASLAMFAVDVVVTMYGTALGLAQRRVAWTTDHRG